MSSNSQNEQDVFRYSRGGVGGGARFTAMGGAFGALGADVSCSAYNPGGLAVFRQGEISYSGGIKSTFNKAEIYGENKVVTDASFNFNSFGIVGVWKAKLDPESRNIFAFSNTQTQNFKSNTGLSGYTNSNSIAKDMLNLAKGKSLSNLNNSYEGLGYDTYLLNYDTVSQSYFSFLDIKRTVKQERNLVTSGRVNELNFSYAHCYKDKFYLGMSIGFPQVKYESTSTHLELDDNDSMRISLKQDGSFTSTYVDELPYAFDDKLGFNGLIYEEYFKTTGGGINLKLGTVMRVNEVLRLGAYYHSPTTYNLTDEYYSSMSVSFDAAKLNPEELTYPTNGGIYSYKIKSPSKTGINAACIFQKQGLVSLDYEIINYARASLKGTNASDFVSTNEWIKNNYSMGHNFRTGAEYNLNPFKIRLGYAMYGNSFGKVFIGNGVRNMVSLGFGYRSPNDFFVDAVLLQTFSKEEPFLFSTLNAKTKIVNRSLNLGITIGFKF